ncbi:hypothetical protein [Mesomycoplasma ovipneumoniae]|uniref:hypothetical protein n=1 Tax=Mesomycoplasma ovipneumoniae TaxID=29562 RepID=UPI00083E75B5|nr:hypothetical protein [Mesomycoplasma ovipneumoniae]
MKDVVKSLCQKQKDNIIDTIFRSLWWLKDNGKNIEHVSLLHIDPKDKEEIEYYQNLTQEQKDEYEFDFYFCNLKENLNKYLENEYVLAYSNKQGAYEKLEFFKNADELILYAIHHLVSAPSILAGIFDSYKKNNSEQLQELIRPKLKM